jgi:hypothetical protein
VISGGEGRRAVGVHELRRQKANAVARQGEGLGALAPILLGQTQEAIDQKSSSPSPKPRRQWDGAQIVEALTARYEPGVSTAAKALIDWMKANADRVSFNDAPNVGSTPPSTRY